MNKLPADKRTPINHVLCEANSMPWFATKMEATRRYSQEQYLSERPITVEELFAPETLDLPGVLV